MNLSPKICNICGGKVVHTSNADIYGKQYGSGYCYLCIDCNSNQTKYNGESYHFDKELFFLLRYHSGFYLWFDEDKLKELFNELQDEFYYEKVLEQRRLWLEI